MRSPFDVDNKDFGRNVGWSVAVIMMLVIAAFIGIVFVASHFIAKVW